MIIEMIIKKSHLVMKNGILYVNENLKLEIVDVI